MAKPPKERSDKETAQARDRALFRALNTPPNPKQPKQEKPEGKPKKKPAK